MSAQRKLPSLLAVEIIRAVSSETKTPGMAPIWLFAVGAGVTHWTNEN
jgi:hypothetical protein